MSNYLLLRNNRETGPFSLENLVQMGLKPYDLIWVDGKSAAWRYPGEIPELKPYAPALEEQPFDRFFKKPEPAVAAIPEKPVEAGPVPQQAPSVPEPVPSFSDYESRYIPQSTPSQSEQPRRSVFVTMPKGRPAAEPAAQRVHADNAPRETKSVPIPAPTQKTGQPAELETKYVQPLDDIKEMYVRTLQQRNHRASKEHVLKTYGRRAAVIVGLLGAGLLLGFIVLKKPAANNTPVAIAKPTEVEQVLALNDNIADTSPEEKMPADAADQSIIQDLNSGNRSVAVSRLEKPDPKIVYKDQATEPVQNNENRFRRNTTSESKEIPEQQQQSPNYGYEPSAHNSATGERAKAVRDERNEENRPNSVRNENPVKQEVLNVSRIPERLAGQLKVNSNDYKRVALGGIRDLRLTVTNESAAALAKVVVELQYLKPNEEPLKTEMVSFRGIGPNESSTIRMPDTNRGIKVKYKIVEVVE